MNEALDYKWEEYQDLIDPELDYRHNKCSLNSLADTYYRVCDLGLSEEEMLSIVNDENIINC